MKHIQWTNHDGVTIVIAAHMRAKSQEVDFYQLTDVQPPERRAEGETMFRNFVRDRRTSRPARATIIDLGITALVIAAAAALPGGLLLAWYFNEIRWVLVSVAALIFFMAG